MLEQDGVLEKHSATGARVRADRKGQALLPVIEEMRRSATRGSCPTSATRTARRSRASPRGLGLSARTGFRQEEQVGRALARRRGEEREPLGPERRRDEHLVAAPERSSWRCAQRPSSWNSKRSRSIPSRSVKTTACSIMLRRAWRSRVAIAAQRRLHHRDVARRRLSSSDTRPRRLQVGALDEPHVRLKGSSSRDPSARGRDRTGGRCRRCPGRLPQRTVDPERGSPPPSTPCRCGRIAGSAAPPRPSDVRLGELPRPGRARGCVSLRRDVDAQAFGLDALEIRRY